VRRRARRPRQGSDPPWSPILPVRRLMNGKRQKNQISLALEPTGRGETPVSSSRSKRSSRSSASYFFVSSITRASLALSSITASIPRASKRKRGTNRGMLSAFGPST
jgi:hypothetical protein